MSKAELAVACFEEGFMCSQAVLSTYSEQFGLPREAALKIAETFGGDMVMGKTCGAVTGALMVIGLKHGRAEAGDDKAKEKSQQLVQDFVKAFEARNGTVECRELLKVDISTPEGLEHARDYGLFDIQCPKFVQDAAEIIEDIL
jgi:C_GCAxxG_C_C family probable redox protein